MAKWFYVQENVKLIISVVEVSCFHLNANHHSPNYLT